MNFERFRIIVNKMQSPRILELGTKRANPRESRLFKKYFVGYSEYLGLDMEKDIDVDIIGDIHKLSEVVGEESFDAIISVVTFEHIKYPFLAAHEIMKTLKIGGWLFLSTVQTFSLHNYPCDYFRFSTDALRALFGTKMGFEITNTCYQTKVKIIEEETNHNLGGPAWRMSSLLGTKKSSTPKEYIYELEDYVRR